MKKFPFTFIPNKKNPHKISSIIPHEKVDNLNFVNNDGNSIMLLDLAKAAIDKLKYLNISEAIFSKKIYTSELESDSIKLENEDLKEKLSSLSQQMTDFEDSVNGVIRDFRATLRGYDTDISNAKEDIKSLSSYNYSSSGTYSKKSNTSISRGNRTHVTSVINIKGTDYRESKKMGMIRVVSIISLSNVIMHGSGDRVLKCDVLRSDSKDGAFDRLETIEFKSNNERNYNSYSRVYIDRFLTNEKFYKFEFYKPAEDGVIDIGEIDINVFKI